MAKNCTLCRYFTGYYAKTYCGFYREKFGRCAKHDKITDKKEICDNYEPKTYNRKIKTACVINALSDAITDINTIKNILEERPLK